MEKLGKYIKKCWRPDQDDKETASNQNNNSDGPIGNSTDDLEEVEKTAKPQLDLKDVFTLFISESQEAWQRNLNSLITRVRESQGSLASENFDASASNGNFANLGTKIFRHGASTDEINEFFLRMDPKRFCLPLDQSQNSRPATFTATLRTIQNSETATRPGGGTHYQSRQTSSGNEFLNDKERELYKRVLQCAHYPVLSSPSSEPPVTPYSSTSSQEIKSSGDSSATPNDGTFLMSPTDTISIEPDMLMKLLRESFGISQRLHERYYVEVKKNIPQRDSGKLLLHELQDRLYRLETNSDNYYRCHLFINPDGYPKWRTKQISNTKALIRRFWKKEMPRNLGMGVGQIDAHKEYLMLQDKLFDYEMKTRRDLNLDSVDDNSSSVFPISTAARKLLKEFGLRYGVCSLFRQIAALVCMAEKFENTGWFIKFATRAVFHVDKILQNCDIIVEDEKNMLERALVILHQHIEYTFMKIRKLCPSKIHFDTISWILEMLNAIIKIKEYLGILEENCSMIEALVQGYIEEAVCEGYGKFKELAMIDNTNSPYSSGTTAMTFISLLHDMRKELKFYEELSRKCPDLNGYFDVTHVVANKLYMLCMKDIKELMVRRTQTIETSDIDDKVLRLVYQLAKLDNEWVNYIEPSAQKWRIYFMLEMHVIMTATSEFSCKQVRSILAKDNWKIISFKKDETRQMPLPARERVNTLVTVGSVVQSERSAFAKPVSKSSVRTSCSELGNSKTQSIGEIKTAKFDDDLEVSVSDDREIKAKSSEELVKSTTSSCSQQTHDKEEGHRMESGLTLRIDVAEDMESTKIIKSVHNIEKSRSGPFNEDCDDVFLNSKVESPDSCQTQSNEINGEYDVVLLNNKVESDDTCATHAHEIELFIRALLDDLITHVDRVEDFQIDLYVHDILENTLRIVRGEMNRSGSDVDSRIYEENNYKCNTLLDNVKENAGQMDSNHSNCVSVEFDKDCDSDIAKILRNRTKTNDDTFYTIDKRKDLNIDCCSHEIPIHTRTSGAFEPVNISVLQKPSSISTDDVVVMLQNEEALDTKRVEILQDYTKADTSTRSFSLPSCDFVSLREKALRSDLPKSKSHNLILDGYQDDDTGDVLFLETEKKNVHDSTTNYAEKSRIMIFSNATEDNKSAFKIAVEKRKKFISQLSTNIQNRPQEVIPRDNESKIKVEQKEHAVLELPKEGIILTSSSLVDVLYMVLRISGFYNQLCDTLAPAKIRSNENAMGAKSESEIIRENFALSLVTNIGELLTTYGDGLLALDVCGLDDVIINEVLESEVYNRLKNKQNIGLIGGCRHDRNRRMSMRAAKEGNFSEFCPKVSKIVKYCIGEWESLTPEMCIRINNTRSLLDLLLPIEDHAKQMCFGSNPSSLIYWPRNKSKDSLCQALETCRKKLHLIWLSQARILAYRIAYMLEEIVAILLTLSLKWTLKAPYKEQMKPISVFLDHQMKILHENLRPVSVKAVVKALWNRVILILHDYAKELRVNRTDPKYNAERFIQLISVLLRHLAIDNETGDNLLNRCRAVLLRFRLHSLSSDKLELMSDIARNLESDSVNLLRNLTVQEILLDIRASRLLPKVFSGENFVNILVNNEIWLREFSLSLGLKNDDDDRALAVSVGKVLFRSQMIVCVDNPPPNIREFRSPIRRGGRAVRIGSKIISISQDASSEDSNSFQDDAEEDYNDNDDEQFHDTEHYLYTVSARYCNESDLFIEIWRVFRQAGNAGTEFAHVIHADVVSILEYRAFWKRDKHSKNILKSVAPNSMRDKAFSCPFF